MSPDKCRLELRYAVRKRRAARGEINVLINSGELLRAMAGHRDWNIGHPPAVKQWKMSKQTERYLASGKSPWSRNDNPLSLAEDSHLTCGRTRHLRSHLLELRQ
jgi:hypothetical protein